MTDSAGRDHLALSEEQPIGAFTRAILSTYALILKFYPKLFSENFGAEMLETFTLAVQEAFDEGPISVLSLFYRELVDLPVTLVLEHIHQRRKSKMQLIRYESSGDVQSARLLARGLSLVFLALSLATFINYGIGNAELTPAGLVLFGISISMMLAWRWEKIGGGLTMIASPLGVISAVYMLRGTSGSDSFGAFLVGVAMSSAALIVGWLFQSISQHSTLSTTPGTDVEVHRGRQILIYFGIALVVITLLAITLFSGPYRKVEGIESGVRPEVTLGVVETVVP